MRTVPIRLLGLPVAAAASPGTESRFGTSLRSSASHFSSRPPHSNSVVASCLRSRMSLSLNGFSLTLPSARFIRSSGVPYCVENRLNFWVTVFQVGVAGYLFDATGQRQGEGSACASHMSRTVYPTPRRIGGHEPVQPGPLLGTPSSAVEPSSLGGSSLRKANRFNSSEVGTHDHMLLGRAQ